MSKRKKYKKCKNEKTKSTKWEPSIPKPLEEFCLVRFYKNRLATNKRLEEERADLKKVSTRQEGQREKIQNYVESLQVFDKAVKLYTMYASPIRSLKNAQK